MKPKSPIAIARAAAIFLGAGGIVAQTVLLRELLAQFSGNELYVGLIIGIWIVAEAGGGLACGRLDAVRRSPVAVFCTLTLLFSLAFPLCIFLVRSCKVAAALPLDQALSLPQVAAVAAALIIPPAILHGAQFIAATAQFAAFSGGPRTAPGRAYAFDTLGTILGGVLVSFVLLPLLSSFQSAALLLLAGAAVAYCLQRQDSANGRSGRIIPAVLLVAALLLAVGGPGLERLSLALQWRGKELLKSSNSPYQSIAVIRNQDQRTIYTDGRPLYAFPDADIEAAELFVHLPLLAHRDPRRLLLVGGGGGGLLPELLRYTTVTRVDYLELDPAVLASVREYADPATLQALADPRVRVLFRDGRDFVRSAASGYDVILIGMPLPQNLQENRYFSVEFFRQLAALLGPKGVMALLAPGSTAYYGLETKRATESLLATCQAAFSHTLVLPGDNNLFLAANDPQLPDLNAGELSRRLAERGITPRQITPEYLQWLFDPSQLAWFSRNISSGGTVNSDLEPYLLARQIFHNTETFSPELKPLLRKLGRLSTGSLLPVILLPALFSAVLGRRRPRVALAWLIAATGCTAMVLELALLLLFQLLHGAMIRTIGLLIALFMAGLWCGSTMATADRGPVRDRRLLAGGDVGLILLCGGLLLAFAVPGLTTALAPAAAWLLLLPLLSAGFCTGLQFPPAARLAGGEGSRGPALIYALDLLGGCCGGFAGGLLLLPLLGLRDTVLLLLLLKAGSFLALHISGIGGKIQT